MATPNRFDNLNFPAYVYAEFPKMVYKLAESGARLEHQVGNKAAEDAAVAEGWSTKPDGAPVQTLDPASVLEAPAPGGKPMIVSAEPVAPVAPPVGQVTLKVARR